MSYVVIGDRDDIKSVRSPNIMEIGPDKEIDPDNGNRSEYYGNRSGQWKSIRTMEIDPNSWKSVRTMEIDPNSWKSIRTVGNRSEQCKFYACTR